MSCCSFLGCREPGVWADEDSGRKYCGAHLIYVAPEDPVVLALQEAQRDILECLRQLRIASTETDPAIESRARALASVSAIDAGVEITWCLRKLGVGTETFSQITTSAIQAEEKTG